MSNDTNMLQAILREFQELKKEMRVGFKNMEDKLTNKIDALDEKLTKRIDRLGNQLAYLEDDTPTKQEFNQLEKRATKIEKNSSIPAKM